MPLEIPTSVRSPLMNLHELKVSNVPIVRVFSGLCMNLYVRRYNERSSTRSQQGHHNLSGSHATEWHLHCKSMSCMVLLMTAAIVIRLRY